MVKQHGPNQEYDNYISWENILDFFVIFVDVCLLFLLFVFGAFFRSILILKLKIDR